MNVSVVQLKGEGECDADSWERASERGYDLVYTADWSLCYSEKHICTVYVHVLCLNFLFISLQFLCFMVMWGCTSFLSLIACLTVLSEVQTMLNGFLISFIHCMWRKQGRLSIWCQSNGAHVDQVQVNHRHLLYPVPQPVGKTVNHHKATIDADFTGMWSKLPQRKGNSATKKTGKLLIHCLLSIVCYWINLTVKHRDVREQRERIIWTPVSLAGRSSN